MRPCDDSEVSRVQKREESLEILDLEACENIHETSSSLVNERLKNSSCGDGKDLVLKDKDNDINSSSPAFDEEDDEENLFRLSVLFVRGNPFDNLKHWRMRSDFLEANLRISGLGRISEVDEEFLNISEQRNDSLSGVRFIQVETKKEELQATFEAKYEEDSRVLNDVYPENKSSLDTVPDDLEKKESDLTSLKHIACENAVVDETKSTKDSLTSLVDAACEQDERKTFSSNSWPPENTRQPALGWQSMDETPTKSSPRGEDYQETDQMRTNERSGLFTKILRRIVSFVQGRKNDVRPAGNSQRQSTTIPQSSV